jgi:hypothetical protein
MTARRMSVLSPNITMNRNRARPFYRIPGAIGLTARHPSTQATPPTCARYVRLVRFTFLILIGRFAMLDT